MNTHGKLAAVGMLVMIVGIGTLVSATGEACVRRSAPRLVVVDPAPALVGAKAAAKSDSPLFGGTPFRNMVNLVDKNVPTDWNVEPGKFKNIKWAVALGDKAYGGPVIADG